MRVVHDVHQARCPHAILVAEALPAATASGATLHDIGLQLYTVRDPLTADFAGTFR